MAQLFVGLVEPDCHGLLPVQAARIRDSAVLLPERQDRERLARSLERKDATLLRKGFLIVLCRMWSYRSDIWRAHPHVALAAPRKPRPRYTRSSRRQQ